MPAAAQALAIAAGKPEDFEEDSEGFVKPSQIGFQGDAEHDIDNNLKMRLFPFHEMKRARVKAKSAKNKEISTFFEKIFGVSNIQHLMGPNFQQMPGVILTISLGGFPTNEITLSMKDIKTHEWMTKYLCSQIGMIANHLYFYRDAIGGSEWGPNWGGLCLMLDITEGTILSRQCNVYETLNVILETDINFSLVENEFYKTDIKKGLNEALSWLIDKFYKKINFEGEIIFCSLYEVFILVIYTLFRRFKHWNWTTKSWSDEPKDSTQMANFHDYNARIYLIKRRGRFINDKERGKNGVPFGDMPAAKGEENLSPISWKAMAQYYRFMPCFMNKTTLYYGDTKFPIFTLRRFVTRDAHATGSSSLTSIFDAHLFNTAAEKNKRLVMFGVSPGYKSGRHASLGIKTMVMQSNTRFGILAGICWFFNPNMEELFLSDSTLKLPFETLKWVEKNTGKMIIKRRVPKSMPEVDCETFLRNTEAQENYDFFVYGVDEYVLSLFVANRFEDKDSWNEFNLLFFQIHWFQSFIDNFSHEYDPILNALFYKRAQEILGKHGNLSISEFTSTYMTAWHNISLETFFSSQNFENVPNSIKKFFPTISKIKPPIHHLYNNAISKFESIYPSISTYVDYFLECTHRYDTPFYWRQNLKREKKYLPNNMIGWLSGLKYVIQNPINHDCLIKNISCDDERKNGIGRIEEVKVARKNKKEADAENNNKFLPVLKKAAVAAGQEPKPQITLQGKLAVVAAEKERQNKEEQKKAIIEIQQANINWQHRKEQGKQNLEAHKAKEANRESNFEFLKRQQGIRNLYSFCAVALDVYNEPVFKQWNEEYEKKGLTEMERVLFDIVRRKIDDMSLKEKISLINKKKEAAEIGGLQIRSPFFTDEDCLKLGSTAPPAQPVVQQQQLNIFGRPVNQIFPQKAELRIVGQEPKVQVQQPQVQVQQPQLDIFGRPVNQIFPPKAELKIVGQEPQLQQQQPVEQQQRKMSAQKKKALMEQFAILQEQANKERRERNIKQLQEMILKHGFRGGKRTRKRYSRRRNYRKTRKV